MGTSGVHESAQRRQVGGTHRKRTAARAAGTLAEPESVHDFADRWRLGLDRFSLAIKAATGSRTSGRGRGGQRFRLRYREHLETRQQQTTA